MGTFEHQKHLYLQKFKLFILKYIAIKSFSSMNSY